MGVPSLVARPAHAQVTRADTAAVLLDAARTFEAGGRTELAEGLLALLVERYGDTESGMEAAPALAALTQEQRRGQGQAGFVVWSTIFGGWMGVAVPSALGAKDPEMFGLGLLLAAPAGFFASRAYGMSQGITVGASRTITFSWMWGTWQAMGWREALDLGTSERCFESRCFEDDDEQAPWAAAVVGGSLGYVAGIAATRAWDVSPTAAEMLWHSSIWGTGYGFALGYLAGLEDDNLLASGLVGGNLGLLASIPGGRAWNPTRGQVRVVSVAGLAGAVAGVGLDLLLTVDDEKTAVAIPTVGATLGLIGGAILTAGDGPGSTSDDDVRDLQSALLNLDGEWRLGVPVPTPALRPRLMPDGTTEWDPGARFTLFRAIF